MFLSLPLFLVFLVPCFAAPQESPTGDTDPTETSSSSVYCPNVVAIRPCSCSIDYENQQPNVLLHCESILSTRALTDIMDVKYPNGDHLHDLAIENSTFARLSKETFAGKTFAKVNVSRHTGRLTVSADAFEGMEDYLTTLVLHNTSLSAPEFLFSLLPTLKKLEVFELDGNDLGELPNLKCPPSLKTIRVLNNPIGIISRDTFRSCQSLEVIELSHTQIRTVGSDTFLDLTKLKSLNLPFNGFSALRQNSFRLNAPDLQLLNLAHNDLFQLEDGWYAGNIGSQTVVELNNNNLTTLPKDAIEPLLREIRTGYMKAYGNPIVCGCEVAWLIRDSALRRLLRTSADIDSTSGIRCHRGAYDHWVDRTNWFGNALLSFQGNLVQLPWIRDNPLLWPVVEGLTGRYFSHLRATEFNNCPW